MIPPITALERYEDICTLPLDVGYYGLSQHNHLSVRDRMNRPFWTLRAFTSVDHMSAVVRSRPPDILITHWHDWRAPAPSGGDARYVGPTEVVASLRRDRGSAVNHGPLLVGEYSPHDSRFTGRGGLDRIAKTLGLGYDMLFEHPADPEILPWNLAIGLWNLLSPKFARANRLAAFTPCQVSSSGSS